MICIVYAKTRLFLVQHFVFSMFIAFPRAGRKHAHTLLFQTASFFQLLGEAEQSGPEACVEVGGKR